MLPSRSLRRILSQVPIPGQVARPLLNSLDRWIDYETPASPLELSRPSRRFIVRNPREYIQRSVYFLNYYEIRETRYVRKVLKPGGIFVDVGANIGWFTILASCCVGETGRVFAFEPSSRVFQHLCDNVAANRARNVTVERLAISNKRGNAILTNSSSSNDGMGTIVASGADGERVPTETLDAYWEQTGVPVIDLLKVDVEGAEMLVFEGMKRLLSGGRIRSILFEYHRGQQNAASRRSAEVFEFLGSFAYEFSVMGYFGSSRPFRYTPDLHYANVIASARTPRLQARMEAGGTHQSSTSSVGALRSSVPPGPGGGQPPEEGEV